MKRLSLLALSALLLFAGIVLSEDLNSAGVLPDENAVAPVPEAVVKAPDTAAAGLNVSAPDENAVVPSQDISGTPLPDLNQISPNIIFVSPLELQALKGVEVIIASLQNFGEITAAWFTLGGVDFNGFVSGSTITADFNTFTLANGVYDLKATA
ncbi:MAG TPA: hypothetical protein VFF09_05085, partial [archaeon]|nr:hypothetical protein [archaeon]